MSIKSDRSDPGTPECVLFGERMIVSGAFKALFREGMGLVEETAAYLDGDGRREARSLTRTAALAYATESMRLTTRLMQVASWLLIQRAANEGEMTPQQALEEKSKVRLAPPRNGLSAETLAALPARLRELMAHSERLQQRVQLLERQLGEAGTDAAINPVGHQLALIRTAFGA